MKAAAVKAVEMGERYRGKGREGILVQALKQGNFKAWTR